MRSRKTTLIGAPLIALMCAANTPPSHYHERAGNILIKVKVNNRGIIYSCEYAGIEPADATAPDKDAKEACKWYMGKKRAPAKSDPDYDKDQKREFIISVPGSPIYN